MEKRWMRHEETCAKKHISISTRILFTEIFKRILYPSSFLLREAPAYLESFSGFLTNRGICFSQKQPDSFPQPRT